MLYSHGSLAQTEVLESIVKDLEEYSTHNLQEKIYVHTDRDQYLTGESLWFKIYNVDGVKHKPLNISKVAYLELVDQNNEPILQIKSEIAEGKGDGSIFLPASINSGNYYLRAYTNWMKNFEPEFFFHKPISIINPFKTLGLQEKPAASPAKMMFFPEGGNLVSGLQSNVAFKVVNNNGKGVDGKGWIIDEQTQDTIQQIETLKFGIGQFNFTPKSSSTYLAYFKDNQGNIIRAGLPEIFDTGMVMSLQEDDNNIVINVSSSFNSSLVYLIGHTRNTINFAEAKIIKSGKAGFNIDKDLLGAGISHFTLFDQNKNPIGERLFFKRPDNNLVISALPGKKQYRDREEVTVEISTRNSDGQSIPANLSISVYRLDSISSTKKEDIQAYMWFTSDLNGKIENPEYYFEQHDQIARQALDNLMLTHGWRRFSWDQVFSDNTQEKAFIPEYNGHIIKGKISNQDADKLIFDKIVYLSIPGKKAQIFGARSKRDGTVLFETHDFYGANKIVVQMNQFRDSTYQINIHSPYSEKFADYPLNSFYLSEKLENTIAEKSINMQVNNAFSEGIIKQYQLPEVDSLAFYGKPDSKYLLDDYTRFPTMEDVMREYVANVWVKKNKGKFSFLVYDIANNASFKGESMVLLDGIPVFDIDKIMEYDPLKVEKIELVKRKYFHGVLTFDGIVSYTTYEGNLDGFQLDPRTVILDYDGLELKREFYHPEYQQDQNNLRKPDFRELLFWSANESTGKDGRKEVRYFTSDQAGTYQMVVQGMNEEGLFGSYTTTFKVTRTNL